MRREYTLSELAAAVGMTERNVRAYRSRGLIPPPRLRGRVGYYGFDHLARLRLVQALTGRGLSLTVVGQLLERGLAQHELARLLREDLPGGRPVPISCAVVEEVHVGDPALLESLVEQGIGRRTEHGMEADPALASLANHLVGSGVPVLEVAQLCLAGAEAAAAAQGQVRRTLRAPRRPSVPGEPAEARGAEGQPDGDQPEGDGADWPPDAATVAVVLEFTTTAFRLALESALNRPER